MKSTLFLIVFCLCSSFVFADQFEDMPLEMMIDKSECIISGKVLEKIETIFSNGEQYEISLIGVNRIIMSNIQLPEKIKVRVYRGSTLYDQIVMNNFRPKLSNKEEVILFLHNFNGNSYEVYNDFRGKLEITSGKIDGTPFTINEFCESIEEYSLNKKMPLSVNMPDITYHFRKELYSTAKTAHFGKHLSGQFSGAVPPSPNYSLPISITFIVNPDSAYNYEGDSISFDDIVDAVDLCCIEWNNVDFTNIQLSVDDTNSTSNDSGYDGESVICFRHMASNAGGTCSYARWESGTLCIDIKMNTRYRWSVSNTYPSEPQDGWPDWGFYGGQLYQEHK
ncbi:MAG: hypothetical protein HOC71_10085 [Candidatus Latescibacteria bacterium]|jgi:hypothetical protein|nr:hypothetical protein [Candidatus Latescibacterota bacterium]